MIIGIGTDLCSITRIEQTLKRFDTHFTTRLFHETECAYAEKSISARARRYAQFFAAKEACSKALGTGLSQGVFWRDMRIHHLKSGQPTMQLYNGAYAKLCTLCDGQAYNIQLSLTDECGMAHAMVIIEKL